MLKISEPTASHDVTLKLEGRLIGPWVNELREVCEVLLASERRLALNLAEVEFVERNGVALLSALQSRGVSLAECSPFLREQLKGVTTP